MLIMTTPNSSSIANNNERAVDNTNESTNERVEITSHACHKCHRTLKTYRGSIQHIRKCKVNLIQNATMIVERTAGNETTDTAKPEKYYWSSVKGSIFEKEIESC